MSLSFEKFKPNENSKWSYDKIKSIMWYISDHFKVIKLAFKWLDFYLRNGASQGIVLSSFRILFLHGPHILDTWIVHELGFAKQRMWLLVGHDSYPPHPDIAWVDSLSWSRHLLAQPAHDILFWFQNISRKLRKMVRSIFRLHA